MFFQDNKDEIIFRTNKSSFSISFDKFHKDLFIYGEKNGFFEIVPLMCSFRNNRFELIEIT